MKKLKDAIDDLEHALTHLEKAREDDFYFAGIAKQFEVCLEYAWKYMKQRVEEEGLEAPSPKEAIKQAGRIGLIQNVDLWLDFLQDRNVAVHDYLGMSNSEYLKTIQKFFAEVKKMDIRA